MVRVWTTASALKSRDTLRSLTLACHRNTSIGRRLGSECRARPRCYRAPTQQNLALQPIRNPDPTAYPKPRPPHQTRASLVQCSNSLLNLSNSNLNPDFATPALCETLLRSADGDPTCRHTLLTSATLLIKTLLTSTTPHPNPPLTDALIVPCASS